LVVQMVVHSLLLSVGWVERIAIAPALDNVLR
jgi:hypothetical protein